VKREFKYIPLEKSPLYRIGRKRDLAALLSVTLPELRSFTKDSNFREWVKDGEKPRTIEEALPRLAVVLGRLHKHLAKIETPAWLMSGKKKVRPQDNAIKHLANQHMVTVDLAAFYNSTRREYVYTAFRDIFGQADDVASPLADLVTYKGHVPTGTATSQIVAFWAYRKTFQRIHSLCESHGITMTLWVDDITFSSAKPLPDSWVDDIDRIMAQVSLTLKKKKTKIYGKSDFKIVTGSAISPSGEMRVKNIKRLEILRFMRSRSVESLSIKETRQLQGKLTSQRQNEAGFFEDVYQRVKRHLHSFRSYGTTQKRDITPMAAATNTSGSQHDDTPPWA